MQHCTIDNDAAMMPADEVVYHVNAHINYRPLPSLYEQCICVCVGIERIKIKEFQSMGYRIALTEPVLQYRT